MLTVSFVGHWEMIDKTQSEHKESGLGLKADVRAESVDFAFGEVHNSLAM